MFQISKIQQQIGHRSKSSTFSLTYRPAQSISFPIPKIHNDVKFWTVQHARFVTNSRSGGLGQPVHRALRLPEPIPKRLSDERGYFYQEVHAPRRSGESKLLLWLLYLIGAGLFISGVFEAVDYFVNPPTKKEKDRKTVVIVGGGWGGLSCASVIDTNRYDVVVVSPRDHFLFTPYLPEVALGELAPTCVTEPVRGFLNRTNPEVTFHEASCTEIDPQKQTIKCKDATGTKQFDLKYDKLVLAVGGVPNTANIKGVKENCLFLREIHDTAAIRKKILDLFETASLPNQTDQAISQLLNFVVVGGGPASIQLVNGLHALLDDDMKRLYPKLIEKAKITFVNNFDPTNTYDGKIQNYFTKNALDQIREQVNITESKVAEVQKDNIVLADKSKIPYGACIWMAASAPSPLVKSLQAKSKKLAKIDNPLEEQVNDVALLTNQYLQVNGFPNIYAIGECGSITQNYLFDKWMEIFEMLDDNKDGHIDPQEFAQFVPVFGKQYPQLLEFAKKAEAMFEEGDINKDGKLTKEEFQDILKKVDRSVTSFPTTAQTAQQQGRYLAHAFNNTLRESEVRKIFHELDQDKNGTLDVKELKKGLRRLGIPVTKSEVKEMMAATDANQDNVIDEDEFVKFALEYQQTSGEGDWKKLSHMRILPFRYKHLGGFEYVGYEQSITFRGSPGYNILDGYGAWWLWRSILVSKMVGKRTRVETLLSWATTKLYGRNIAKY